MDSQHEAMRRYGNSFFGEMIEQRAPETQRIPFEFSQSPKRVKEYSTFPFAPKIKMKKNLT